MFSSLEVSCGLLLWDLGLGVFADGVVRTHPHHMEDLCWVNVRLDRVVLVRKQPLQILLEIMAFEVIGDILITVVGMSLVGV